MEKKKKSNAWIWILLTIALLALVLSAILLLGGGGSDWQEQYDLGCRYLENGNYEEAILAFSSAIEIDPKRVEAYLGRGEAYMELGDYEKARDDFEKAERRDPDNEDLEELIRELEQRVEDRENQEQEETREPENQEQTVTVQKRLTYIRIEEENGNRIQECRITYDAAGNIVGKTWDYQTLDSQYTNSSATSYYYNEAGQLILQEDADGSTTEYAYDAQGRLSWRFIKPSWGEGLYDLECLYEYDEQGNLVRERYGNEFNWNERTYEYDDRGNLLAEYDTYGFLMKEYSYDAANRMTSCTSWNYGGTTGEVSSTTETYTYDQSGTLTGKTVNGESPATFRYQYYPWITVEQADSYGTLEIREIGSYNFGASAEFEVEEGYLVMVTSDTGTYEFQYEVIPEAGEATEDPYQLYKDYFYSHCSDLDMVYLADVTHDGVEDMLVVSFSDADGSEIRGTVYTAVSGTVTEIYSNYGSNFHVGGFYGWYLIPVEGTNSYNLCEESFGMWQGIGVLTFIEYALDNQGNRTTVEELILDSTAEGNHDANNVVTEAAWNAYTSALSSKLSQCYAIYYAVSEGTGSMPLVTDPAVVFAG